MTKNSWNRKIGFLYLNLALDYSIRGNEKKRMEMQDKAAKRFGYETFSEMQEHFEEKREL